MSARRRRAKVVPLPTPAAPSPPPRIDRALLDEARKESFVLLLALDGYFVGAGTYRHEDAKIQHGALSDLALSLSNKLATISPAAAARPEP